MLFVLFVIAAGGAFAQTPTTAVEWRNRGIQLYREGKYADAAHAFQQSVTLQPDNAPSHLYLGTALMMQFVPGAAIPGNSDFADRAAAEFRTVLELEPDNAIAIESLASLAYHRATAATPYNQQYLDEAADWNRKLVENEPENKGAYYSLGVISWCKFYPELMQARNHFGMKPETPGPLPDSSTRHDLMTRFGGVIEEGMVSLRHALDLDPDYFDAMAYLNLLIRERADLRDTPGEYQKDVAVADEWMHKAVEVKRRQSPATATVPPPPPPPPSRPMRPSYGVPPAPTAALVQNPPDLITKVEPVYPPLARQAQVRGVVQFQVTIGRDGKVKNIQLLSGHPLLVVAATQALKQWVYRPTFVNGEAVEVVTHAELEFK